MTTEQQDVDRLGGAVADVLDLDFRRSVEIKGIAERLIAKHGVTFAQLGELKILYLLRSVQGEMDAATIDALAKCVKAPALWRDVFSVDVAIWVDERYWKRFTERQREAIVMHELLHVGVNDKGRVKLLEHSIEEFGLVVATYGQWRPELERFARQMGMFDEATQGDQTTIDAAIDETSTGPLH